MNPLITNAILEARNMYDNTASVKMYVASFAEKFGLEEHAKIALGVDNFEFNTILEKSKSIRKKW